ncbi:interleukin-5 receptor subunit alpha-like [Discoglossus pictus]
MNMKVCHHKKEFQLMMLPKTNNLIFIIHIAIMEVFVTQSFAENRINIILKQPNVTHSQFGFHAVTLSWPEQHVKDFDVVYKFDYRYLDKEIWIEEKITENKKTIKLWLHPGFIARVQAVIFDHNSKNNILAASNWTEYIYYAPTVYINNVSCVIYNVTSLNCSWALKNNIPSSTQYSFSLRHNSDWLTCKHCITTKRKKNIGCHMKDVFLEGEMKRRINIKFSNGEVTFLKSFLSASIEMLTPPINISLSLSEKGNTKIKWQPPISTVTSNKDCFKYQIKLEEMKKDPLTRVIPCSKAEYLFSDLDKKSKYSVQIQGRNCAGSKFWGEWSNAVYIGKENEGIQTWILLLIIVICTVFTGSLLIYLCKRYPGKLFTTTIPDPSKKIKYWMSSSEINVQKSVAGPNEVTPINTQIEIVTED